jgi:hypothetical protein
VDPRQYRSGRKSPNPAPAVGHRLHTRSSTHRRR